MNFVDERYKSGVGLRWWPEQELVRFLGATYSMAWGSNTWNGQHALDLGCGNGRNSWLLAEAGFHVTGCDKSEPAVRLARDYLAQRRAQSYSVAAPVVAFHAGDALMHLSSAASDSLDLIVDCQTLQHVSEGAHLAAYQEIARTLRSGGRFWTQHWADGDAQKLYAGEYPELRRWSVADLHAMLYGTGLVPGRTFLVTRSEITPPTLVAASWFVTDWRKP
jgi:SAM-dependent methyltransferase